MLLDVKNWQIYFISEGSFMPLSLLSLPAINLFQKKHFEFTFKRCIIFHKVTYRNTKPSFQIQRVLWAAYLTEIKFVYWTCVTDIMLRFTQTMTTHEGTCKSFWGNAQIVLAIDTFNPFLRASFEISIAVRMIVYLRSKLSSYKLSISSWLNRATRSCDLVTGDAKVRTQSGPRYSSVAYHNMGQSTLTSSFGFLSLTIC